jgi:hypothetical protein
MLTHLAQIAAGGTLLPATVFIFGYDFGDIVVDKIENPPAFPFQPVTLQGEPNSPEYGMTLRDWFAGQAFGAAMGQAENLGEVGADVRADAFKQLAGIIYEAADAMLAAREGGDA